MSPVKALLTLFTALALAAPAAGAQSFSQLPGSAEAGSAQAPEPSALPEAVEDPSAPNAAADFLVKPEAEHDQGAELFDPWQTAEKSVPGAPKIPFFDIAKAEAKAQSVDLALVLAVIQKESSFDPHAHSAAGAKGLMQVLPDTARWLGLRDTRQLTKPAVNIKYGVKYLKYLWDEFAQTASADISPAEIDMKASQMALAAYNAGQGNVRKYNGVPPFKETRNYVEKVTRYFKHYEDLLKELAN